MSMLASVINQLPSEVIKRCAVYGAELGVLAGIYDESTNIAIWQRELPEDLHAAASLVLATKPSLGLSVTVSPQNAYEVVSGVLGAKKQFKPLFEDMASLVDMFCCLFDADCVGLRLTSLRQAMCPRFHVDNVPCRLVTTYCGDSTQWLAHNSIDRSKLGPGSGGVSDEQSGLFSKKSEVKELRRGEIALLKGEGWAGNEGGGLVHRSPTPKNDLRRLLLTLDLMNS